MAVGHQSVGGFNIMAKVNTAKGKLVRKFGENIFGNPKYDRLLNRKPYSPGQHGQSRRGKLSNYGVQLQEKQKIKFMYGLLEKQFRLNFEKAEKMTGETGTNMLQLLESRLDNVVYRLGFASTRAEGRQLVSHKSVLVNGKNVNIPSYQVAEGDEISIAEKSQTQKRITQALSLSEQREECEWVSVDKSKFTGTFKNLPTRELLSSEINENYIVELYSR